MHTGSTSAQLPPSRDAVQQNAIQLIEEGRQTFRFDTFGDEDFWGGTLKLHQAIEGAKLGGIGSGVSPKTALAAGLKVDVDALPANLLSALNHGQVNLDDPRTTLVLLKFNAVVGVTGFFNSRNAPIAWDSVFPVSFHGRQCPADLLRRLDSAQPRHWLHRPPTGRVAEPGSQRGRHCVSRSRSQRSREPSEHRSSHRQKSSGRPGGPGNLTPSCFSTARPSIPSR